MRIFKTKQTQKQRGLTLVEALAFLAIFGIVAGGAVAMFFSGSNSASSNQIASDVNGLKAAIKSQTMAGQPMANITTATLSASGRLSKNMTNQTSSCASLAAPCATYGDGTSFKINGSATQFSIVVDGLNTETCESVRIALTNSGPINTPTCSAGQITFTYR